MTVRRPSDGGPPTFPPPCMSGRRSPVTSALQCHRPLRPATTGAPPTMTTPSPVATRPRRRPLHRQHRYVLCPSYFFSTNFVLFTLCRTSAAHGGAPPLAEKEGSLGDDDHVARHVAATWSPRQQHVSPTSATSIKRQLNIPSQSRDGTLTDRHGILDGNLPPLSPTVTVFVTVSLPFRHGAVTESVSSSHDFRHIQ